MRDQEPPDWALPSWDAVPADPDDTVAHITLLGPFAGLSDLTDGVLDELERFFADVTAFDFRLTGIHTFPGGTVYLSPSPAAPFRQLTHELSRLFPEHPPYGGAFDDVVPHLTVPMSEGEDVAALEFELGSRFPISTYAREAVLFCGPHADQWLAASQKATQLLRRRVGQRPGRRPDRVSKMRQRAGIQRIRLG